MADEELLGLSGRLGETRRHFDVHMGIMDAPASIIVSLMGPRLVNQRFANWGFGSGESMSRKNTADSP
jgi:hypothetical protein